MDYDPINWYQRPRSTLGEVRSAPVDPSLPPPWKEVFDVATGRFYYWDTVTNVTQFDKPTYSTPFQSSYPFPYPDPVTSVPPSSALFEQPLLPSHFSPPSLPTSHQTQPLALPIPVVHDLLNQLAAIQQTITEFSNTRDEALRRFQEHRRQFQELRSQWPSRTAPPTVTSSAYSVHSNPHPSSTDALNDVNLPFTHPHPTPQHHSSIPPAPHHTETNSLPRKPLKGFRHRVVLAATRRVVKKTRKPALLCGVAKYSRCKTNRIHGLWVVKATTSFFLEFNEEFYQLSLGPTAMADTSPLTATNPSSPPIFIVPVKHEVHLSVAVTEEASFTSPNCQRDDAVVPTGTTPCVAFASAPPLYSERSSLYATPTTIQVISHTNTNIKMDVVSLVMDTFGVNADSAQLLMYGLVAGYTPDITTSHQSLPHIQEVYSRSLRSVETLVSGTMAPLERPPASLVQIDRSLPPSSLDSVVLADKNAPEMATHGFSVVSLNRWYDNNVALFKVLCEILIILGAIQSVAVYSLAFGIPPLYAGTRLRKRTGSLTFASLESVVIVDTNSHENETSRISIVNLDWRYDKAGELLVLLWTHVVYHWDFGIHLMKVDEFLGPIVLFGATDVEEKDGVLLELTSGVNIDHVVSALATDCDVTLGLCPTIVQPVTMKDEFYEQKFDNFSLQHMVTGTTPPDCILTRKFHLGVWDLNREVPLKPCHDIEFVSQLHGGFQLHFAGFIKDFNLGNFKKGKLGLSYCYRKLTTTGNGEFLIVSGTPHLLDYALKALLLEFERHLNFVIIMVANLAGDYCCWKLSMPLSVLLEHIEWSDVQVLGADALPKLLLPCLTTSNFSFAVDTPLIHESLTGVPGSYHHVVAQQMGLYLPWHISIAFVKLIEVSALASTWPNQANSLVLLIGAASVKPNDTSNRLQDVVVPRNLSPGHHSQHSKLIMELMLFVVPIIHCVCYDNSFARKMVVSIASPELHCEKSTDKLAMTLEVVAIKTIRQLQPHHDMITILDLKSPKHEHGLDFSYITHLVHAISLYVTTMSLQEVSSCNPYLIQVLVRHFPCQCQHWRSIVDPVIASVNSLSELSFMRHAYQDILFVVTNSTILYSPFHALVKQWSSLLPLPALPLFSSLLISILRDEDQINVQHFLSFVELQTSATLSLMDVTGCNLWVFDDDFNRDKKYFLASKQTERLGRARNLLLQCDFVTSQVIQRKARNDGTPLDVYLFFMPVQRVGPKEEISFMRLMHKTPWDVALYPWRLFGSHLSIAQLFHLQCQGVECFLLKYAAGLCLLPSLYKPVSNTASMRTLRCHVPAFSVLVGDAARRQATIPTLSVATSCFAELMYGFSIPPALTAEHHKGHAFSIPPQLAQLTPIYILDTLMDAAYVPSTERSLVSAVLSWAYFLFPTCLRPEDMPYLKGGGMLGPLCYTLVLYWANLLTYLSGLLVGLGSGHLVSGHLGLLV